MVPSGRAATSSVVPSGAPVGGAPAASSGVQNSVHVSVHSTSALAVSSSDTYSAFPCGSASTDPSPSTCTTSTVVADAAMSDDGVLSPGCAVPSSDEPQAARTSAAALMTAAVRDRFMG